MHSLELDDGAERIDRAMRYSQDEKGRTRDEHQAHLHRSNNTAPAIALNDI